MEKLVIFDLDGTLINTLADLARSTNYALQACGFPIHPEDSYRNSVGNGILRLFERALPQEVRTEENILRIKDVFLEHYREHQADHSTPYPGILELLEKLRKNGCTLAVASNKYQAATEQMVRELLPGIHFAVVLGQRDGVPVKPDPGIVHEIIKTTGMDKRKVLYVGDSDVDMQTARNAGVTACGVTWGFRSEEELARYAPWFLVHSAEEINEIVEKMI